MIDREVRQLYMQPAQVACPVIALGYFEPVKWCAAIRPTTQRLAKARFCATWFWIQVIAVITTIIFCSFEYRILPALPKVFTVMLTAGLIAHAGAYQHFISVSLVICAVVFPIPLWISGMSGFECGASTCFARRMIAVDSVFVTRELLKWFPRRTLVAVLHTILDFGIHRGILSAQDSQQAGWGASAEARLSTGNYSVQALQYYSRLCAIPQHKGI